MLIMSLSHIGCDLERLTHVVENMSPGIDRIVISEDHFIKVYADIRALVKATIKHLQTKLAQLSRFEDMTVLGYSLVVDSLGSDHVHYLLWADGEDKVVLNVQGILAEAYVLLIASSANQ